MAKIMDAQRSLLDVRNKLIKFHEIPMFNPIYTARKDTAPIKQDFRAVRSGFARTQFTLFFRFIKINARRNSTVGAIT